MRRTAVTEVRDLANRLLCAAGLEDEKARAMADKLVESDLLGHGTHGLAMLPIYLERLQAGRIAKRGSIEVIADTGDTFSWQANRLPGAWVMERALAQARMRNELRPVVTATIANCSHIGCLQAYLEDIGRGGRIALLMVTDPGVASVAPFGGADPVVTSNPIAACIPTHEAPILIDQTTSLVSNRTAAEHMAEGRRLPGPWLLDSEGNPTDDPSRLFTDPPGSIRALGGDTFGYKGFGFGLLVEAFALALSGWGRKVLKPNGTQGVFLQLIDPARFAGLDVFLDETTELVRRCKASRLAPGHTEIRMPGERALRHKATCLAEGLVYPSDLLWKLDAWAAKLGMPECSFLARSTAG